MHLRNMFRVSDVKASIEFYCSVLESELVESLEQFGWAYVKRDTA